MRCSDFVNLVSSISECFFKPDEDLADENESGETLNHRKAGNSRGKNPEENQRTDNRQERKKSEAFSLRRKSRKPSNEHNSNCFQIGILKEGSVTANHSRTSRHLHLQAPPFNLRSMIVKKLSSSLKTWVKFSASSFQFPVSISESNLGRCSLVTWISFILSCGLRRNGSRASSLMTIDFPWELWPVMSLRGFGNGKLEFVSYIWEGEKISWRGKEVTV